jgi:hypothetical protein
MPLPDGGPWPPRDLDPVTARLAVWSTWYSGDPDLLSELYGGTIAGDPGQPLSGPFAPNRPGWRGRVGRAVARWFWGLQSPSTEKRTKLHVPLAGDIAATSADMLFSEPASFTIGETTEKQGENNATQDRLNELCDDGMHADLLEAAEICAGLGGVYLRVCWDTEIRDRPWLGAVHADAAIPEWRWNQLSAVTFWRVVREEGDEVWRHLERHEPGFILHGLYRGARGDLGVPVQFTEADAMYGLPPEVPTGLKQLTADYVPNVRPNRVWRDVPAGAYLGRADIAGTEPLMDALDEVYSSLMRDIRLAKARLHLPETYLQSLGKGQGAAWNAEQEIYYGVEAIINPGASGQLSITPTQFAIRVDEHLRSAQELANKVVQLSGYSTQTFGDMGEMGEAVTATEVTTKQRRTYITRDRKLTYWRPRLANMAEVLLAVDAMVFKTGVEPQRPDVKFGDGVSEDPQKLAQTAQLLLAAEAASLETRVRLVNPGWDDDEVREEIERIEAEKPQMPDLGFGEEFTPGEPSPNGSDPMLEEV